MVSIESFQVGFTFEVITRKGNRHQWRVIDSCKRDDLRVQFIKSSSGKPIYTRGDVRFVAVSKIKEYLDANKIVLPKEDNILSILKEIDEL